MHSIKKKLLVVFIYVFTAEKAVQHLLTSLLFIISVPGIGTPDIGPNFQINSGIMAILNLIYFLFFVTGIIGLIKGKKWAIGLIIILACLDIILEFIFHGFLFITVSVIISTILAVISILYLRISSKNSS